LRAHGGGETEARISCMRPFSLRFLHWLGPEKEQGIVARAGLTVKHAKAFLTCTLVCVGVLGVLEPFRRAHALNHIGQVPRSILGSDALPCPGFPGGSSELLASQQQFKPQLCFIHQMKHRLSVHTLVSPIIPELHLGSSWPRQYTTLTHPGESAC
jgi:hypothetical protein